MTGENGVAQMIIFFNNVLETWNSKFTTFAYSGGKINDADWLAFYAQMDEWLETLAKAITFVGKPSKDSVEEIDAAQKQGKTKRM